VKTTVYVDAFNLYFGAVRGTPFRWLDLAKLCTILLPKHQVQCIKYFTARLRARPSDLDQPRRQEQYLRALRTIPGLEIHFGHFLSHVVRMPLANPPPGQPRYADVVKTKEKGSDVNLATHLVLDAHRDAFECAVVLSGDSDLLLPVVSVIGEFGKPVGVINPQRHPCRVLQKHATFYKHIRKSALRRSQFPKTMTDARGSFTKPASW